MHKDLRSEPLINLLAVALDSGTIDRWDVEGRCFVFYRGDSRFSVRAISAGTFLLRLIEEGPASAGLAVATR